MQWVFRSACAERNFGVSGKTKQKINRNRRLKVCPDFEIGIFNESINLCDISNARQTHSNAYNAAMLNVLSIDCTTKRSAYVRGKYFHFILANNSCAVCVCAERNVPPWDNGNRRRQPHNWYTRYFSNDLSIEMTTFLFFRVSIANGCRLVDMKRVIAAEHVHTRRAFAPN